MKNRYYENPIRILCVMSTLDRGGAETMCMNLYRHMDRSKVQFDFVKHTHQKGAFEDEIMALGGRIFEAPRYKIYNHFQYRNWWKKHLQNHPEHQIIHGHFFTISAVFFSVARKMGRIAIGHSHCTPSGGKGLKHELSKNLCSKIESRSDYCFACSRPAGEWLFPHRQFTVLNNAIDAEQFRFSPAIRREVRTEYGFGDSLVLGTVASMQSIKNPFGLLDIFAEVKKKAPSAKLLWVGDGALRKDIEKKAAELGLIKDIVFTGVRSDVARLEQAMDAFLLPSFSEGLPVSAIEAQAAGLRCFISDRVTTETDITGRCEFLPIDKPELWAEAICAADLEKTDTSAAIAEAGYDIHTTAKWLEDFYLQIVKD